MVNRTRRTEPKRDCPEIIVVTGLPRSGTSLLMQMLAAGGIDPLVDRARPPDEDNPRGYFEYEPAKRIEQDRGWLARARARAVKIVAPPSRVLSECDERFAVLFVDRPLAEVLASQRAMLARAGKRAPAEQENRLAQACARARDETRAALAAAENVRVLDLHYHALLSDPHAGAERIARFLAHETPGGTGAGTGHAPAAGAMAAAVDLTLYRRRIAQARAASVETPRGLS